MKIVKCLTALFTVLFVVSFASPLSAKSHRHRSTFFSFSLNTAPAPVVYAAPVPVMYAPAPVVYENRTYVTRPTYPCRYPVYGQRVYAPSYREEVMIQRSYPAARVYEYPRYSYWGY